MKTTYVCRALGTSIVVIGSLLTSSFAATPAKDRAPKPADAPGWIVIEDDFYYPMALEPVDWFDKIQDALRASDEKAAASELRKAESWLNIAASHALPISQQSLKDESAELGKLAGDLESGKTIEAAQMKSALERSSKALADWHYFNAEKNLADGEEVDATRDLRAASRYLKWAATSSSYEFGDDFVTVYDNLTGWSITDEVPNDLTANLKTVKTELDKLSKTMTKTDK